MASSNVNGYSNNTAVPMSDLKSTQNGDAAKKYEAGEMKDRSGSVSSKGSKESDEESKKKEEAPPMVGMAEVVRR